jgi:hypothetical protein
MLRWNKQMHQYEDEDIAIANALENSIKKALEV